jgi:hypothetical protein
VLIANAATMATVSIEAVRILNDIETKLDRTTWKVRNVCSKICGGRWGATSKTMAKRRSAAAAKASGGPPPRALFFMHTSIESASASRMA